MNIKNEMSKLIMKRLLLFLMFVLVDIVVIYKSAPKFENVVLKDSERKRENIKIPFERNLSGTGKDYIFAGTIRHYPWSQNWIHIIPDDHLEYIKVNGKEISIANIPATKLSDWKKGFHFNLGQHLKFGENAVEIQIVNYGGKFGLSLTGSDKDIKKRIYVSLLIYVTLFLAITYLLRGLCLNKKFIFIVFGGLPIYVFIVTFAITKSFPIQRYVILRDSRGNIMKTEIPFFEESSPHNRELSFACVGDYHLWSQNWVHIIPDDRLEYMKVNGKEISLSGIPISKLSDWEEGFHFNLSQHLKFGKNGIKIKVADQRGLAGLRIIGSFKDPKRNLLVLMLLFPFFLLFFLVFRLFRFNKALSSILLLGLLVRLGYLAVTPYFMRSHDVLAHIDYIEFIANNLSLPRSNQGWVFYHPPLYYVLSAVIYQLANLGSIFPQFYIYTAIQFFSLLISFAFTIISVLIFQQLVEQVALISDEKTNSLLYNNQSQKIMAERPLNKETLVFMISVMFIFWPSNIIHSVRIGNDCLLYLFYSLGLLFLIRWNQTESNRNFYLSVLFGLLALITKLNGIIVIALISVVLLYRLFNSKNKFPYVKKAIIAGILCLVGLGINYRSEIAETFKGNYRYAVVRNAPYLNPALSVKNSISNYIYFDLKMFIIKPFTNCWIDEFGRQFYWHFLLKSCLFGEFGFSGKFSYILGVIISLLTLVLLIYIMVGMVIGGKSQLRNHAIIILNFIGLLAASIFVRISVPVSSSGDFRYIMPALVSLCFFAGLALVQYRRRRFVVLEYLGYGLTGLFVLSNILFFADLII